MKCCLSWSAIHPHYFTGLWGLPVPLRVSPSICSLSLMTMDPAHSQRNHALFPAGAEQYSKEDFLIFHRRSEICLLALWSVSSHDPGIQSIFFARNFQSHGWVTLCLFLAAGFTLNLMRELRQMAKGGFPRLAPYWKDSATCPRSMRKCPLLGSSKNGPF